MHVTYVLLPSPIVRSPRFWGYNRRHCLSTEQTLDSKITTLARVAHTYSITSLLIGHYAKRGGTGGKSASVTLSWTRGRSSTTRVSGKLVKPTPRSAFPERTVPGRHYGHARRITFATRRTSMGYFRDVFNSSVWSGIFAIVVDEKIYIEEMLDLRSEVITITSTLRSLLPFFSF